MVVNGLTFKPLTRVRAFFDGKPSLRATALFLIKAGIEHYVIERLIDWLFISFFCVCVFLFFQGHVFFFARYRTLNNLIIKVEFGN